MSFANIIREVFAPDYGPDHHESGLLDRRAVEAEDRLLRALDQTTAPVEIAYSVISERYVVRGFPRGEWTPEVQRDSFETRAEAEQFLDYVRRDRDQHIENGWETLAEPYMTLTTVYEVRLDG